MSLDQNNPKIRLPVGFCLDVSGSMQKGNAIADLNSAFLAFRQSLLDDAVVGRSAELAVVAFALDLRQVVDFVELYRAPALPELTVRMGGQLADGTNIGAAVNHVIDLLESRRAAYRQAGTGSFQPMLVVMSDGEPHGPGMLEELDRAASRTRDLEAANKLLVFPVAIGAAASLDSLGKLSARATPAQMTSRDFGRFFRWFKESMRRVSVSSPGQQVLAPEPKEYLGEAAAGLGPGWKVFTS